MRETIKFILFCLPWFFFFTKVSSKPHLNEFPSDLRLFDGAHTLNNKIGLREEEQSFEKHNSISNLNQRPTHKVNLAFGTRPFSNAFLERISGRSNDKSRDQNTNSLSPIRRGATAAALNTSQGAFLKWITALVSILNFGRTVVYTDLSKTER
jgi:hypothetical protein